MSVSAASSHEPTEKRKQLAGARPFHRAHPEQAACSCSPKGAECVPLLTEMLMMRDIRDCLLPGGWFVSQGQREGDHTVESTKDIYFQSGTGVVILLKALVMGETIHNQAGQRQVF